MDEMSCVGCVEEEGVQMNTPALSVYHNIPAYSSPSSAAFWAFANDKKTPLELLVKVLRSDAMSDNRRSRDDIFEIINKRVRRNNEQWAYGKLSSLHVSHEERQFLIHDLCADLDFAIYRSLIDKTKYYWEEKFNASLHFERRHVFSRFIQYERFWKPSSVKQGTRIPRVQMISIDKLMQDVYRLDFPFDIEDGQVQRMMESVEMGYVRQCVLKIPHHLRVIVYLIYWNGKTSKEIAQMLHVSDRTVRNRLHLAYELLRDALDPNFF